MCLHIYLTLTHAFFFLSLMCTFWETQSFVLWFMVYLLSGGGAHACVYTCRGQRRGLRRMSSSIAVCMCTHVEAWEGCLPLLLSSCVHMQRPEKDVFLYCSLHVYACRGLSRISFSIAVCFSALRWGVSHQTEASLLSRLAGKAGWPFFSGSYCC